MKKIGDSQMSQLGNEMRKETKEKASGLHAWESGSLKESISLHNKHFQ